MWAFLGLVVGMLTLFIPTLFWPRDVPKLSSEEFREQFPDKKRVHYIHIGLAIFWLLFYLVILFPILWNVGDNNLYLASFLIGGGLAILHGIVEIRSFVSMRNFSRSGPATYVVDESIRRFGWLRIGSVITLGIFGTVLSVILG